MPAVRSTRRVPCAAGGRDDAGHRPHFVSQEEMISFDDVKIEAPGRCGTPARNGIDGDLVVPRPANAVTSTASLPGHGPVVFDQREIRTQRRHQQRHQFAVVQHRSRCAAHLAQRIDEGAIVQRLHAPIVAACPVRHARSRTDAAGSVVRAREAAGPVRPQSPRPCCVRAARRDDRSSRPGRAATCRPASTCLGWQARTGGRLGRQVHDGALRCRATRFAARGRRAEPPAYGKQIRRMRAGTRVARLLLAHRRSRCGNSRVRRFSPFRFQSLLAWRCVGEPHLERNGAAATDVLVYASIADSSSLCTSSASGTSEFIEALTGFMNLQGARRRIRRAPDPVGHELNMRPRGCMS